MLAETDMYVGNSTTCDCRYGRNQGREGCGGQALFYLHSENLRVPFYSIDLTGKVSWCWKKRGPWTISTLWTATSC